MKHRDCSIKITMLSIENFSFLMTQTEWKIMKVFMEFLKWTKGETDCKALSISSLTNLKFPFNNSFNLYIIRWILFDYRKQRETIFFIQKIFCNESFSEPWTLEKLINFEWILTELWRLFETMILIYFWFSLITARRLRFDYQLTEFKINVFRRSQFRH